MESLLSEVPASAWTRSLVGVPAAEHRYLDEYFGVRGRRFASGAGKARDEGCRLWMDGYVRQMSFFRHNKQQVWIVSCRVRPSMRASSPYSTYFSVAFDGDVCRGWCTCKAGADGKCKHVAAAWYFLWSLQRQNVVEVPPDPSPTDVPAYWKARTSVPSSAPLHFEDIIIVKHKAVPVGSVDADAAEVLNPARTSVAEHYEPFDDPSDRLVTSGDLRKLVGELAATGEGSMVVDAIVSNNFQAVYDPAIITALDHPYHCKSKALVPPSMVHHEGPRVTLPTTSLSPATGLAWPDFLRSLSHGCHDATASSLPLPSITSDAIHHDCNLTPAQERLLVQKGVCVSEAGSERLECATRAQSNSQMWFHLRQKRLTASNFGSVLKRNTSSTPKHILNAVLGKVHFDNEVRCISHLS